MYRGSENLSLNLQIRTNPSTQRLQKYHDSSNTHVTDEPGIKHGNKQENLRFLDKADVSTAYINSGLQFSRYTIAYENVLLTGALKVEY